MMRREHRHDALSIKLERIAKDRAQGIVVRLENMIKYDIEKLKQNDIDVGSGIRYDYQQCMHRLSEKKENRLAIVRGAAASRETLKEEISQTAAFVKHIANKMTKRGKLELSVKLECISRHDHANISEQSEVQFNGPHSRSAGTLQCYIFSIR
jgi:hypothetical protein